MYSKEKRAIDFRALGIKAGDSVLLLHAVSYASRQFALDTVLRC